MASQFPKPNWPFQTTHWFRAEFRNVSLSVCTGASSSCKWDNGFSWPQLFQRAEALPSKVGETTRCIEEEKHLALCILFIGFLVKISISYTYIYYIRIRDVCILLLLPSINYLLISRTPGKCQDGDYGTVGDLFYQGFAWVWDCTLSSKQW